MLFPAGPSACGEPSWSRSRIIQQPHRAEYHTLSLPQALHQESPAASQGTKSEVLRDNGVGNSIFMAFVGKYCGQRARRR